MYGFTTDGVLIKFSVFWNYEQCVLFYSVLTLRPFKKLWKN